MPKAEMNVFRSGAVTVGWEAVVATVEATVEATASSMEV